MVCISMFCRFRSYTCMSEKIIMKFLKPYHMETFLTFFDGTILIQRNYEINMYWTYVLKIPLTSFFVYEKFIFDYDKLEHYTRIIIYSNFNLRIRIFKNCLWYISLTAWKNVQFEGYYEIFFWLLWKWRNKKKPIHNRTNLNWWMTDNIVRIN